MISLQKILDLSPSQIYPGHGPIIQVQTGHGPIIQVQTGHGPIIQVQTGHGPIIQVQTGGWGVIYIMLLSKYLSTGWPEKNNIRTNEYLH